MMQRPSAVRVAVIGLGWWGKKMTAVRQKANEHAAIVGAAGPHNGGAAFAAANGFRHYASDRDAMSHPGVEAVILATPHSLHAEQIERAVAAGLHIFCEKP